MLSSWIQSFRLRTLPLAAACIGMGGILAAWQNQFNPLIFGLTLLTAFLLQILSNLANDYGDSVNGADSEDRLGPSRAVQSGKISAKAMKNAMVLLAVLSLISGVLLIFKSLNTQEDWITFLALGIVSIIAAITYTVGKRPYGYMGLGDISVLFFFGILAVGGTYYLQTKDWNLDILLPALSCGLLSVGVLNLNNIRDIESDKKAGKYSIPVRLGRQKSVYYHWLILLAAWVCIMLFLFKYFNNYKNFIVLLSIPLFIINARAVLIKTVASELDPYLKQLALSTLLFVVLFGIGVLVF